MLRKLLNVLLVVLFLGGAGIFFYPVVKDAVADHKRENEIQVFEQSVETEQASESDPLYTQMKSYNEVIYQEGLVGMSDAWDTGTEAFDYSGTGMIGYVTIDRMDVNIPLYVGADDKTLYDGAAILAHTSMPIGGANTNCVIAAHRGGYEGTAMFRDIEKLQIGDLVRVSNLWDTLEYRVIKMIVIEPDDLETIKIVPGQDLVTLVTCHPYGSNAQRYVVYCQRVTEEKQEDAMIPFEGEKYVSSAGEIEMEDAIRFFGCVSICVVLTVVLIRGIVTLIRKHR